MNKFIFRLGLSSWALLSSVFSMGQSKEAHDFSYEGLVCQLNDTDLINRKKELQEYVFSELKKVEELEDGYTFYFPDEPAFVLKLMDYVLAERKCCPFFFQKIQFEPGKQEVSWTLYGSAEIKAMVQGLLRK